MPGAAIRTHSEPPAALCSPILPVNPLPEAASALAAQLSVVGLACWHPLLLMQLYLPRGSLEGTDITTAKSSEVNVILPGATGAPLCCFRQATT